MLQLLLDCVGSHNAPPWSGKRSERESLAAPLIPRPACQRASTITSTCWTPALVEA